MPQVPYTSSPSVEPQQSPTPEVQARTSPDVFGGAVGSALGQFGSTLDRAGDEVYARANAMQQMAEEAKARSAQLSFDQQSAQLHADFITKEGLNAGPEALAQHTKDLADLRQQVGGTLSSPFARKTFDAESMPMMGRLIFNAAGHSGQQLKVAYDGGLLASAQAAKDTALQSPGDDLQFKAGLQRTEQEARDFSASHGYDPGRTAQTVKEWTSGLVAERINGLTRSQPLAARQMLDSAIADGSLRGEDILKVKPKVDAAYATAGAKQIGDGVRDGSLFAMGKSVVDIERAKDAIGGYESGNIYDKLGPEVEKGRYKGQQALGRYGVMPGNLPQWLKDSGLPPMTSEQFRHDNAAQDKVFETKFGGSMKQYNTFNDAASVWFTGQPMATADPDATDATSKFSGSTQTGYLTAVNKRLAEGGTVADQMAAARREAAAHAPDVPLASDMAEQRVLALHHQDNAAAREVQLQNKEVIDSAIAGQRGQAPATLEQLSAANPQVAKAVQGLDGPGRLSIQRQLQQAQSQDNVPSPERDTLSQTLEGMSYSNPDQFRNINLYGSNLTADQRTQLRSIQSTLAKGGTRDVHVDRAIGILKTQMDAAGVDSKADKVDYNQFTGAVAQEMRSFQQQKGRAPDANEIEDMGRRLLMTKNSPPRMFGLLNGTTPTYQMTPPSDYTAAKRAQHPELTDDDIRRMYVHRMYNATGK